MRLIDPRLDFVPRTLDPLRVYRADPDRALRRDGRYVLYWTQIFRRPRHNHALNYAVERANELGLPVVTAGMGYPVARVHAPTENIRIDLYLKHAKHMARVMAAFGTEA